MNRKTKAFLSMALSVALLFTGVNLSAKAAQMDTEASEEYDRERSDVRKDEATDVVEEAKESFAVTSAQNEDFISQKDDGGTGSDEDSISSTAKAKSDESGFDIVDISRYLYTDEKSFSPQFTISSNKLAGDGALTAEIAGHSAELEKTGEYYTGTIDLGEGLSEGKYTVTVKKGDTEIGSKTVYVIAEGVFYQSEQNSYDMDGETNRWYCTFVSYDIDKKYIGKNTSARDIWDAERLKLEVFRPDGTEITPDISGLYYDNDFFYIDLTLPEKSNGSSAYWFKITSNDNLGRCLKAPEKSFYLYQKEKDEDRWSEAQGRYEKVDYSILELERYNGQGTDNIFNAIGFRGEYNTFPMDISFILDGETDPAKTITINKADLIRERGRKPYYTALFHYHYFFTEEDLAGLDLSKEYNVTQIYGHGYATKGYLEVYEGEKPSGEKVEVKSVSINETAPSVAVGKTADLTFRCDPSNATITDVSWATSDPDIASVDSKGTVTGVAAGIATITVTVDGKSASVGVSVVEEQIPLTSLSVNNALTLCVNEVRNLDIVKTPENSTDEITFVSSDPDVVTVDNAGKLTALKPGNASVTVRGGTCEATCEVTVKPARKEFTLQRDNNHFANRLGSFYKADVSENKYRFKNNEYYEKLKKIAKNAENLSYLDKEVADDWGGSCYGIASTIGLVLKGRLSLNDLTDSNASDYHSLAAPVNEDKLFDAINYYQAGQMLDRMFYDSIIAYVISDKPDKLNSFLQNLVEHTKDNNPVLFSYGISDSGHALLALNSVHDEDNHCYIVKLYDENTAGGSDCKDEKYSEMVIPEDYSSFDYDVIRYDNTTRTSYYIKLQDNYKKLIIRDLDKLPLFTEEDLLVCNAGVFAVDGDKAVVIDMPWASQTSVVNDKGQTVTLKDGETGGNMPVKDVKYIYADEASRIQVIVDDSEKYTVSSDDMDVSLISGKKILSISGEGIDSAALSLSDDKISLSGNNYRFDARIRSKDSDSMLSLTGIASKDTMVSAEGDTVKAETTGQLSDVSSVTYTGNDSKKEKVDVSEDGKGASANHKEETAHSGMDPEAELNEAKELYLVKGQTYKIAGTGWSVEGGAKAVKVSAKNGVTTLTAKSAAATPVSVTNGTDTYKVYVSVPSAKINNGKSAKLVIGSTAEVKITGIPEAILDKYSVAWVSAKTGVAMVAPSSGNTAVVTAVGKGSSNITAYVGGKAYSCKVTVIDDAKSVPKTVGDSADITLNPMQTVALKYSGFNGKNASWKSMDSLSMNVVGRDKAGNPTASGNGIVKIVTKTGKITAIGEGETTISGTDTNGRSVTLHITVRPLATNPVAYVRCGKTVTLKAPKLNKKDTKWIIASGEDLISSEITNGKVKALSSLPASPKADHAVVTCKFTPYTYGNGFEYTYRVYVEDPSLNTSSDGLSNGSKARQYVLNLKKGAAFSLKDQYRGISRGVVWKNSKPAVAYIDENGVIHANRAGTTGSTNLTATVGGVSLKVTVNVTGE